MRTLVSALALVLTAGGPAMAQTAPAVPVQADSVVTWIHAGRLLDRPGERPRGPSTIIVRDGKVAEVRDGLVPAEAGARLVDLSDRFVLPGLIDMHVHLWGIGGDPLRARLETSTRDDADDMVTALSNARATLDAGFTTVRDLGGDPRGMRALAQAFGRSELAGPTVIQAGAPISVSGGHGDPTNGLNATFADAVHAHTTNTCDGPTDCTRAVREQVALGAQVIKFMATGGVLSNVSGGLGRAMSPEEMAAVIETAHGLGRRVAAHSHAADGTRAAVEAGVDTIDHGTYLDDETVRLMRARGTWLVPTMIAPVTALEQARAGVLPPATIPKAEAAAAAAAESHARAIRAGVRVAFGTDSGVSRHGENAREFSLMVAAGMTPAQAIRAATVDAAEALGRAETLGTIAPGRVADIIAVAGDPLTDVRALESVEFVMHDGRVHKVGGRGVMAE